MRDKLFGYCMELSIEALNIEPIDLVVTGSEEFPVASSSGNYFPETRTLYINESFYHSASFETLAYFAAHQARRVFQIDATNNPELFSNVVSKETIALWAEELKNYVNPNDDNDDEYYAQAIEKDADDFAHTFIALNPKV
ncbi:MAG: hypothetical protein ACNA7U_05235 [Candidatus Izemoplasmataceae bacterium]|uniref:hypothetical protein n=1 Tax=Liberiplasma polymorphum TaxID=3374570 RepID=UPI003771A8C1